MKPWFICIIFFTAIVTGCNSIPFKDINSNSKKGVKYSSVKSSGGVSQPVKKIEGEWRGITHCLGNNLTFDLTIKDAGNNKLKAEFVAEKTQIGSRSKSVKVRSDMVGTYDPDTAYFVLKAINGDQESKLTLKGILDSKSGLISAVTSSAYYNNNCSYTVAGKKNIKSIIDTVVDSGKYKLANIRIKEAVSCDDEIIDWLNTSDAFISKMPSSTEYQKYAAFSLLYDKRFKKYFGKAISKMSSEDLALLRYKLLKPCKTKIGRNRKKSILLDNLIYVLYNDPKVSMSELAIYPYAKKAISNWRMLAIKQLKKSSGTEADILQSKADDVFPILWTTDNDTIIYEVMQAKNRVMLVQNEKRSKVFLDRANELINDKPMTFYKLVHLSKYMENYTVVSALDIHEGVLIEAFQKASVMIGEAINREGVNASTLFSKGISTPAESLRSLVDLRDGPYASLNIYLESSNSSKINKIFSDARDNLLRDFIEDEKVYYSKVILAVPSSLDRLHKANSYETTLKSKYDVLLDSPLIQPFNEERAKNRAIFLGENVKTLVNQIGGMSNISELKHYYNGYMLDHERITPAGTQFKTAYMKRKKTLDPFEGITGKDYLDAIYSGSYQAVRKKDIEYFGRLKEVMREMTARYSMLGMNNKNTRAVIENMTAFNHVFARYLLDYQKHYKSCLPSKTFKYQLTRHTPGTVTRNGYGVEISSSSGYDSVSYYEVDPKFGEMLLKIGTTETDGFSLAMMDNQYSEGRIGKAVEGIREVMRSSSFSCDDPQIKKLEDGFIKIYHQFH